MSGQTNHQGVSTIDLRAALPAAIFSLLEEAARQAEEQGWSLYVVGGWVRDALLRIPGYDVDAAVEGDAPELGRRLADSTGAAVKVHEQFGTATLSLPGGVEIDLVTTRNESYPQPGALPVVEPGTIYDDLARRDFSVNALALRFTPVGPADLIDPHGGVTDLDARLVRVLHSLSFRDDPTRIFRAVKLARRLGFSIEQGTLELILQAVRDGVLYTVSMDRISRELLLIMEEPGAGAMLFDLDRFGVLGAIDPLLAWPYEPGRIRPAEDKSITRDERRDTYLAALGAEMGSNPGEAESLARRLRLPAPAVRLVRESARLSGLWPRLGEEEQSKWQTYSLLRGIDARALQAFSRIEALQADEVAWGRLRLYVDTLVHIKPDTTGDYLKTLGVEPGPLYRDVLEQLLEAKISGRVPTRADEERFVRQHLEESSP